MDIINLLTERGYKKEADILKEHGLDSIRIHTSKADDDSFVLGESKIGGKPHLPKGTQWPNFLDKPLFFIAQFNLSHISQFDTENRLPDSGMLYFFYEGGIEAWGDEIRDKDAFKVIYYDEDLSELEVVDVPDECSDDEYEDMILSPCKLTFKAESSYPLTQFIEDEEIDYEPIEDIFEEEDEEVINKLFGYPDLVQGDIFSEAAEMYIKVNKLKFADRKEYKKFYNDEISNWMLLFQIDSDDNTDVMWGDLGRVYFTIRKEDLSKKVFDNGWVHFQCG